MHSDPPPRGERECRRCPLTSRSTLRCAVAANQGENPHMGVSAELWVRRGREAVEFYEAAFGAREVYRVAGTDAHPEVVSQLAVGGTTFWVADGDDNPESLGGTAVRLLLVVDDPAAVVARAVALGARELTPVAEEHRWLLGRIVDPFGHHWEIGKPLIPWPPASPG